MTTLILFTFFSFPAMAADCSISPSGTRPEGTIIYNTDEKVLQYCDGTGWIQMHVPGSGSGGCNNPTEDEGKIIYNFVHRVMQGCAGNQWQAMGPMQDRYGSLGAFDFTDQAGVTVSTLIESNIEQITGLMSAAPVSITGDGSPEYRTCTDGTSDANCDGSEVQTWTSTPGTVSDNEYLQIRLTTNAAFGTMDTATVSVGSANDVWNVTSAAQDATPDAFSFNDQTDVAVSTQIESNIVQITSITGSVATSIAGAGGQYRICTNGTSDANCDSSEVQTWTTGATTIQNNQYIQLRLTSSASNSTMVSTTLTIGTVNDQWDVTTAAACGGTLVGGYCWYMASAPAESCTTICSSRGGYNTATRDYAGSNGSNANCDAVMDALGYGSAPVNTVSQDGAGCHLELLPPINVERRRDPTATTAGATGSVSALSMRVCACNN